MSRHLGLIIGVNHYQDSTFRPLHSAENDARALAQWLVNTKGGKWSPPDVQLVLGQHATRELIESLLAQLCLRVAEPGDAILIYFAGHGFVDEKSGEGILALTNSKAQEANTGINLRVFMQQIMARSRASHVLCILDCFQSGQLWSMRRTSSYDAKPVLGTTGLGILQQQSNRLFLCSCRGNEFAPESEENHLGAFMHRMIVGLCGPAGDTAKGVVTLAGLQTYLNGVLTEQHRPQLFGQQKTELILVGDLPETAPAPSPTPAPPETTGIAPKIPGSTGTSTSGLFKRVGVMAPAAAQVPATPPPSSGPSTSGHILTSALDEHRQQREREQMLAQAQQLLQNQNYGEAFNLVEKVLQAKPDDTGALTLKGQLLGTAGRFPEALGAVDQLLQKEPNNALAWSMRAVVLSNMGQHRSALEAIERSLELDSQNPETYAIKTNIMGQLAAENGQQGSRLSGKQKAIERPREDAKSFLLGAALHMLGFIIGIAGPALLIFTHIPNYLGFALASLGLALLCVNAAHGTFRYGVSRLILTLMACLVTGGILGAAFKFGYTRIIADLNVHPSRLVPVLFFAVWLAAAATAPLLLAIIAWISRIIVGTLRRRR